MNGNFRLGIDLWARNVFGKITWTTMFLVGAPSSLMINLAVANEEVKFNSSFLAPGSSNIDLTRYEKGNPIIPGQYRADISVNGVLMSRQEIRIVGKPDGTDSKICFDRKLMQLIGIEMEKLSPIANNLLDSNPQCAELANLIPDASARFDPNTQELDVSLPQAIVRRDARGYVSPELWDRGITAGLLSYNFNAYHSNNDVGGNYDSAYLSLNGGFNMGDWRLRHNGSSSWDQDTGHKYEALNTYAQRDITSWRSQLTLGESNTSGEIFDTVSFRGAQLATDDRMLPQSLRGYAPVVRGIARTNARVTIRQNGNLIYENSVAPGAFVIDDLYSTGYGGDLDVTVLEADGSSQTFIVPFASVSQLLRPGTSRYSVTAGETRIGYIDNQQKLLQATYQRGLNNTFTGYTGVQATDDYNSILAGMAFSTPVGAMAIDMTQAQTRLKSGTENGQSVRLSYSKNILSTGSNFTVAAYRFSSSGFLDLDDALTLRDAEEGNLDTSMFGRQKSRFSVTANQRLGNYGQLVLSGFTQDYWDRGGNDLQYQAGYYTNYRQINFGVSANRARFGTGDMQTNYLFTVSMPLEFGTTLNRPQLSMRVGRNDNGDMNEQATLSGTAGDERQYQYGVTVGHDGATSSNTTSLNGGYTSSKAMLNASMSQSDTYESASIGVSGGIVAHGGGVTFTPYTGDTIGIVHAAGAENARVAGYPGLKVDGNGYAVIPYLRPYELNEVALDPIGSSLDVELEETSQQVAPRSGAVVKLNFETRQGESVLVRATLADGRPLPFGTEVSDDKGNPVGVVGQGGQLFARVQPTAEALIIRFGEKAGENCVIPLNTLRSQKQAASASAICATAANPAKPSASH
ncbi:fimbria/pilus outer membrane usher protein [Pseudomonas sp. TSRC2-2]|uniref:fimbria/pilus outer membrane usher protein n=1 Tax=unclassified Pseudomonas TaxID=196821 RepID=UPI003CF61880